jgi:hypothetical protein
MGRVAVLHVVMAHLIVEVIMIMGVVKERIVVAAL